MNDLEEKDVDEFNSSGTCFAVMGGKCDRKLKWCAVDKMKCIESYGIINTGTFLGHSLCENKTVVLSHNLMKVCVPRVDGGEISSCPNLLEMVTTQWPDS